MVALTQRYVGMPLECGHSVARTCSITSNQWHSAQNDVHRYLLKLEVNSGSDLYIQVYLEIYQNMLMKQSKTFIKADQHGQG